MPVEVQGPPQSRSRSGHLIYTVDLGLTESPRNTTRIGIIRAFTSVPGVVKAFSVVPCGITWIIRTEDMPAEQMREQLLEVAQSIVDREE